MSNEGRGGEGRRGEGRGGEERGGEIFVELKEVWVWKGGGEGGGG